MKIIIKSLLVLFLFGANANAQTVNSSGVFPNSQGQLPSMVGGVAPSLIYTLASAVVSNTTSDTNCYSGATAAGPGATIPANGPYVGNTYHLTCRGVFTTGGLNTATATIKIKFGSVTVVSVTTAALPISLTNFQFLVDEECVFYTVGSSGTLACNGDAKFWTTANSSLIAPPAVYITTAQTPVTVNTTNSNAWQITSAFSNTTSSPSITATSGTIEVKF